MYDDTEFDDPPADDVAAATEQAADTFVQSLVSPPATEPADDPEDYMSEVDRRFEIASHYRELLRAPLFRGGGDAAGIVEDEVRGFVRERLETLMGMREERRPVEVVVAPKDFDPDELQALKAVARKLLDRNPAAPVVVPAPVKADPSVQPAAAPVAPPVAPQVHSRQPPASTTPPVRPRRGRPPGPAKPVQPAAAPTTPPTEVERQVENPETGQMQTVKAQRIQRPAGMIPIAVVPAGGMSPGSEHVIRMRTSNPGGGGIEGGSGATIGGALAATIAASVSNGGQ